MAHSQKGKDAFTQTDLTVRCMDSNFYLDGSEGPKIEIDLPIFAETVHRYNKIKKQKSVFKLPQSLWNHFARTVMKEDFPEEYKNWLAEQNAEQQASN